VVDPDQGTKLKNKPSPKRGPRKPGTVIAETRAPREENRIPPIVGLGASAGGLEALNQFLQNVPPNCGIAFVIVQHMDPTHKGVMPDLLQRSTSMKVVQVKDRTRVEPDCVYVIPPNKDMSILHGVLHLLDPVAPRGLRLPIDIFFRSLALDQQERGIGVILSGMGSDGTLGLRAIKESAGLVLVQNPKEAKFDSMPRSAIDADLADMVAPVAELPGKIIAYLHRTPLSRDLKEPVPEKAKSALEKAVIMLRAHTGHDFSLYKHNSLYRRIERRMGIHQIERIADYIRYLQENSQELDLLFKELLIGVTSFFRDGALWEMLRKEIIPARFANYPRKGVFRAWVPGCSTGEEAFSLAMILLEAREEMKPRGQFSFQIFATDLDDDAIARARQGLYPENIVADVPPERLTRFFIQEERGYRVSKEIREMVIFAQQNLIMDPPFTKLEILSCRNLLIYLDQEMQKKLMPLFHYSLNSGGILILGGAETIGSSTDLFSPIDAKLRLYQQVEPQIRPQPIEFPSSFSSRLSRAEDSQGSSDPPPTFQLLADKLVLQRYAPPSALVNKKGDILYISGRTGAYLEPAAGKANWNIFAMARDGLRFELARAFHKAIQEGGCVTLRAAMVKSDNGKQLVDVTVELLSEPKPMQGLVMIVFKDIIEQATAKGTGRTAKGAHVPRLKELEQALQDAREEARTTSEEMQTTQEELRSTNEELQSTNEEMQSTNEELMTSKEEMQSLNEELQTVNAELQAKVEELSWSNNDMKNLLNSMEIATVFLDDGLKVRRFTEQATLIINLIPGDVGRPVTDLASGLHYPELAQDARGVLLTLVPEEKTIAAEDGRWFTVRIMPYRTFDNRIDGVVITFADITKAKVLEAELRKQIKGPAAKRGLKAIK
jgi:two-component system CheB/CheR fusion protein